MRALNKQMVEQVIQQYILATYEGDTVTLETVFHLFAQMVGFIMGEEHYGTVKPFYDALESNPSVALSNADNYTDIKSIYIADSIATVVL
jgi:hypothetical protein